MKLLQGMSRSKRIAIGAGAGVVINTVVHAALRKGAIINPVFDSQQAGISLAVEGTVAVLDGIFVDPWAGVISGVTGLALFGVDYLASRKVAATAVQPSAVATIVDPLKNLQDQGLTLLEQQGKELLRKIF